MLFKKGFSIQKIKSNSYLSFSNLNIRYTSDFKQTDSM